MAEGIKIRDLDKTTEIESSDAFILDRQSIRDPSISVTQFITYEKILDKLTGDITGGSAGFDPAEGMGYLAFKPSDTPVEIVVTVGPKTSAHRYYGYTDDEGNSASTESYFFDSLEAPFLILVPGITYRLDVSDFSNSLYPMKFYSSASGGGFGGIGTDIDAPRITRSGIPGSVGAYIEIDLQNNVDPRIFYVNDNNYYMGNQIFDPGCDGAFEKVDFDGGGTGNGFPDLFPFTEDMYNSLVTSTNDLELQLENDIKDTNDSVDLLRNDLQTSVENSQSITDSINDKIDSNSQVSQTLNESQIVIKTSVEQVRSDFISGDDEIKQMLLTIQSRLDTIEERLEKVIQVEDQ